MLGLQERHEALVSKLLPGWDRVAGCCNPAAAALGAAVLVATPAASAYPADHIVAYAGGDIPDTSEKAGALRDGTKARYRLVHDGEVRAFSYYVPDGTGETMIVEDWAADGRRVAVRWQTLNPSNGPKGICINKAGTLAEASSMYTCDMPVPEGSTIRWMVGSCNVAGSVTCNSYNDWIWTPASDPNPHPEGAWMDYTDDADNYPGNGCIESSASDC